ncbi:MAG TPA: alpha-L-fucosidase [Terriglobia bacterium]|nr:alpha-L-fucosidase [Terriglobia bacterium]
MNRFLFVALFLLVWPVGLLAQAIHYESNWESLDKRATPSWYDDAKFGIFIHWGVYSVPAYADPHSKVGDSYAEWYWNHMQDKNGPTWAFHLAHYGANFQYQDFAGGFKAELFDPHQWADLFVKSGARYVVLTSKHHEGFCLWPCPASWNWNSVDVGPHRDLAGDLARAVVDKGLKMGFYYSLYEWYNPVYRSDLPRYVSEHMFPQMKDLVSRYHPSILWSDGEWEHPSADWRSTDFLSWLFNDSPVREEIVINDRWGQETRSKHGGFYTSEYQTFVPGGVQLGAAHKWEEDQGIGKSFGYNRLEAADDYKSANALIQLLVNAVSKGGNLLLDIGPTADGRVPVIMQERLLQIGAWLKVNGEAIYGAHPWRQMSEGNVHYTTKGNAVYAIAEAWPGQELVLIAPRTTAQTAITFLGSNAALKWRTEGGKLHIEVPALTRAELALPEGYVFKLTGVE